MRCVCKETENENVAHLSETCNVILILIYDQTGRARLDGGRGAQTVRPHSTDQNIRRTSHQSILHSPSCSEAPSRDG